MDRTHESTVPDSVDVDVGGVRLEWIVVLLWSEGQPLHS